MLHPHHGVHTIITTLWVWEGHDLWIFTMVIWLMQYSLFLVFVNCLLFCSYFRSGYVLQQRSFSNWCQFSQAFLLPNQQHEDMIWETESGMLKSEAANLKYKQLLLSSWQTEAIQDTRHLSTQRIQVHQILCQASARAASAEFGISRQLDFHQSEMSKSRILHLSLHSRWSLMIFWHTWTANTKWQHLTLAHTSIQCSSIVVINNVICQK